MKRPRVYPPPVISTKGTSPFTDHVKRLRAIEGATFVSSRGVKGVIYKEGVYCPATKTFTPYFGEDKNGNPFMRLQDIEDIRRDNDSHITYADDSDPTEEWTKDLIEGHIAAGDFFKAQFAARRLFPRQFKKRYPGPLPNYKPQTKREKLLLNEKPPTEGVEGLPEPPVEICEDDVPF